MKKAIIFMLVLAATFIVILTGCDKQIDEDAFMDAAFYFSFNIQPSDNPDRKMQQVQDLWADIQSSHASGKLSDEELIYYEFGFCCTKMQLIEDCTGDTELAYRFYVAGENIPPSYYLSDLEKSIEIFKEALCEYDRELEYGELSYMCGMKYYNKYDYKNAAIMFTYANGYLDSGAWLEKCNSYLIQYNGTN